MSTRRNWEKSCWFAMWIGVFLLRIELAYAKSEPLVLVRDGTANATIIVEKTQPELEKYAVQELQKYLQKMSGAKINIAGTLGQVSVSNPGFEEGTTGWSANTQSGTPAFAIDEAVKHYGNKSARINCQEPGYGRWYQTISVEPGKKYYFSVWVKAEASVSGALWLHQEVDPAQNKYDKAVLEDYVSFGTTEGIWTKFTLPVFTAVGDTIMIFLENHGGGTIWFDDIVLNGETKEASSQAKILIGTLSSNSQIKTMQAELGNIATLKKEGFIIKRAGDTLIIAGADSNGVLYGTYQFLETLGCRWLSIDELGEEIPVQKTIAVGDLNERQEPDLENRGWHMISSREGHYDQGIIDWMARNKMNTKATATFEMPSVGLRLKARGIKPFTDIANFFWLVPEDKYYDLHPEYYPLIKGIRVRPGNGGVNCQLCLSNPDVAKIATQAIKDFILAYPEVEILGVAQNDGSGWCECDKCRKLYAPGEWAAGIHSTALITFVNRVAEEIWTDSPNKHIGTYAYAGTVEPPAIQPYQNVSINYTVMDRCYKHSLNDPSCAINTVIKTRIEGWLKKVNYLDIYEYYYSESWREFPLPIARTIVEDMKWMKEKGIKGGYSEISYNNWEIMKLNYYTAAKISWNTNLSYAEILDDFCSHYYGPASEAMKSYYQTLDNGLVNMDGCFIRGDSSILAKMLPPDVIKKAKESLARALTLVSGAKETRFAERVGKDKALFDRYIASIPTTEETEEEKGGNPIEGNMVINPGFEMGTFGWLANVNAGKYNLVIDKTEAHYGNKSARINCQEPGWGRWCQTIFGIEAGKKYYFSVWVKAEGTAAGGHLWLYQEGDLSTSKILGFGATEGKWKKYLFPEITAVGDTIFIFLENIGGGTIWFDDVVLKKIEPM